MPALSRREFLAATAATAVAGPSVAADPPKFKLGLVSYMVSSRWDLPTNLKICSEVGVAAVECRTTHKHGVEPTLSKEQRADVRKRFADSGVKFWGSGSTCEFHAADETAVRKQIEECKRFVQLVADLGGTGVKVRPNGVVKGKSVEASCEQIGKALVECGKAAEAAGVEIWVEVHGAVTQLPKHMKRIMDACGHKAVGVTWNSNATDLVNKSIAEGFEMLAPHIRSCHINDLENDQKGTYPYRDLFQRLKGIGYDRYTLCEVGKAFDPDAGREYLRGYKKRWDELTA